VDQVVAGKCREMGYEGVHWIHVAYDQIWKWVLQTWSRSFIFYNRETKRSDIWEWHRWFRISII